MQSRSLRNLGFGCRPCACAVVEEPNFGLGERSEFREFWVPRSFCHPFGVSEAYDSVYCSIRLIGYTIYRISLAMTTVLALQAYRDWFDRLTDIEAAAVQNVVHKLELDGLNLAAPHSSSIKGARHALRELRPKQGRSPLRVLYAYDPDRQAILVLGGDKSGDERWYDRMAPKADDLFDAYLEWLAKQKEDER